VTLGELKKLVNKLNEADLKNSFYVVNKDDGIGRRVLSAEKSRADLYGPDVWEEGIPLRNKTECNKDNVDMDLLELYISKGDFILNI